MKPLFLVGYMGCGKTLGRLSWRGVWASISSTPTRWSRSEGASVADVFRYEGEERFREAERRVLDEVIAGASPWSPRGAGCPRGAITCRA